VTSASPYRSDRTAEIPGQRNYKLGRSGSGGRWRAEGKGEQRGPAVVLAFKKMRRGRLQAHRRPGM